MGLVAPVGLMDIVGPLGLGVLVGLVSSVGFMGPIGWVGLEQRPKNHPGIMALPSGKFCASGK